jgi:hypothetical protein
MKLSQIILEYQHDITARNLAGKLTAAAQADSTIGKLPEGDDLVVAKSVLDRLEKADPTPNQKYMQWIARTYAKGGFQYEDVISVIADGLAKYETLKNKQMISSQDADIGKFHSFDQFEDMIDSYEIPQKKQQDRGDYEVVADTDEALVIWPKDETAAKFWGQSTRWCTAADHNNYFDQYNNDSPFKSGLRILIPKHPSRKGEKYQFILHNYDSEPYIGLILRGAADFENIEDTDAVRHVENEYEDTLNNYIVPSYFPKYLDKDFAPIVTEAVELRREIDKPKNKKIKNELEKEYEDFIKNFSLVEYFNQHWHRVEFEWNNWHNELTLNESRIQNSHQFLNEADIKQISLQLNADTESKEKVKNLQEVLAKRSEEYIKNMSDKFDNWYLQFIQLLNQRQLEVKDNLNRREDWMEAPEVYFSDDDTDRPWQVYSQDNLRLDDNGFETEEEAQAFADDMAETADYSWLDDEYGDYEDLENELKSIAISIEDLLRFENRDQIYRFFKYFFAAKKFFNEASSTSLIKNQNVNTLHITIFENLKRNVLQSIYTNISRSNKVTDKIQNTYVTKDKTRYTDYYKPYYKLDDPIELNDNNLSLVKQMIWIIPAAGAVNDMYKELSPIAKNLQYNSGYKPHVYIASVAFPSSITKLVKETNTAIPDEKTPIVPIIKKIKDDLSNVGQELVNEKQWIRQFEEIYNNLRDFRGAYSNFLFKGLSESSILNPLTFNTISLGSGPTDAQQHFDDEFNLNKPADQYIPFKILDKKTNAELDIINAFSAEQAKKLFLRKNPDKNNDDIIINSIKPNENEKAVLSNELQNKSISDLIKIKYTSDKNLKALNITARSRGKSAILLPTTFKLFKINDETYWLPIYAKINGKNMQVKKIPNMYNATPQTSLNNVSYMVKSPAGKVTYLYNLYTGWQQIAFRDTPTTQDNIYYALLKLDKPSRQQLLQVLGSRGNYPNFIMSHITIAFNIPNDENTLATLQEYYANKPMQVTGYTSKDGIDFFTVSTPYGNIRPDGKFYHITISTTPGVKPEKANIILQGMQGKPQQKYTQPITVTGVPEIKPMIRK